MKHVKAVLAGRGDGDALEDLATVMDRLGYLERLVDTKVFQKIRRNVVKQAIDVWQLHWTARHALHIWDKLELSRSQFEALRHLISFIYNPASDNYEPIRVYEDPNDPTCCVFACHLANRQQRETLYAELVGDAQVIVSATGRCERDSVKLASAMYSDYKNALREDFTDERPAQPFLYVDGTGASLGKGVCHSELGSADFAGTCKQSRATMSPLSLHEGTDHAPDLRENLPLVAESFNRLIHAGRIERDDGSVIPARPGASGDFQAIKALAAQTPRPHSPWCKCPKGEKQHKFGDSSTPKAKSYSEVLAYIKDVVGCEFRDEKYMCAHSHYSYGVHRGGKFTKFTCPVCEYSPSEAQWRADIAAFQLLSDEEQADRQRVHNELGWHMHQLLFMSPLLHLPMLRLGVDQLHLLSLNFFKHLFKYTVHENLPESKKILVQQYLRIAGFYSYDAASVDEDPVKRWIGREVKRFCDEAHLHLPFLLRLANAPIDMVPDSVQEFVNDNGDEEMDVSDDEYEPTPEELEAEAQEEPCMMRDADRWDRFFTFNTDAQKSYTSDTDAYREARAVDYFNNSMACSRDILELKPTSESWVFHVSTFIVPRQIVALGEPAKRGCDAGESFGAMVKDIIKKLTCRRRVRTKSDISAHNANRAAGTRAWKSTFKKGYIEQCFSRCAVRQGLLHGEENAPYLGREQHRLKNKGLKREKKKEVQRPVAPTIRSLLSSVSDD